MNRSGKDSASETTGWKCLRHRLATLATTLLAACATVPADAPPLKSQGSDIYRFVTAEKPYTQWATLPSVAESPDGTPHGPDTTIYLNSSAAKALAEQLLPLPVGAALLIENRAEDGAVSGLEMMLKRSGFYPRHKDWYWLRFSANGKVLKEGAMGECIRCHARMRGNDYIYR